MNNLEAALREYNDINRKITKMGAVALEKRKSYQTNEDAMEELKNERVETILKGEEEKRGAEVRQIMAEEGVMEVPEVEKPTEFESWNTGILDIINENKGLIGGDEGVSILVDSTPLQPTLSRHYKEWWESLSADGKDFVRSIIGKINASDNRHDLDWGNSFRTWYEAMAA